uniref:7TM_GPCR_Srx domain-containing protein n=1 Tax=Heterorhabditis bacteriophora TaxID=37862 RepID=A0A1I7W9F4_HETBA
MTSSQATGEAILCTIFALYFSPMVFFVKNTKYFVLAAWALGIIPSSFLYTIPDCDLQYFDEYWAFHFTSTADCSFIAFYIDFYKDVSIVVLICILDCIAVISVRIHLAETPEIQVFNTDFFRLYFKEQFLS